jgi:hypothetical protein
LIEPYYHVTQQLTNAHCKGYKIPKMGESPRKNNKLLRSPDGTRI